MRILIALAALAAAVPLGVPANAQLVIAHRGASGERPEHTLAAYEKAIDEGADFIEPDLVVTKDLVLVARHENDLTHSTDVASRPEFTDRRKTKEIDGDTLTGWFAEDFTLAELRTLRVKELQPGLRPANARYDGLYQVPTLAEIVALVRAKAAESGHATGIYPELKHPAFLLELGIDSVDLFVVEAKKLGLDGPADAPGAIPLIVQSFEVGTLQRLKKLTGFRLIQLLSRDGGPADEPKMTFAEMVTPSGLAHIARYADAIGPDARMILGADGKPTGLVDAAHKAGLQVHAWTLRKENAFLPPPFRIGTDEKATGNFTAAWALLASTGVDGIFTDDPALAVALRRSARP